MEQIDWQELQRIEDEFIALVVGGTSRLVDPQERISRAIGLLYSIFVSALTADELAAAAIVAAEVVNLGQRSGLRPAVEMAPAVDPTYLPKFVELIQSRLRRSGYLSTAEAAAQIGCSVRHVRRLARRGLVDARIGPTGAWRCTAQSVAEYRRRSR